MNINMWKNLQRIVVFIRFDIKNSNNPYIIEVITEAVKKNIKNEEMCEKIYYIMPKWKKQLMVEDEEGQELLSNKKLKQFIIKALELMKYNILNQEYEIAYDIADMLQGLPENINISSKKDFKQYWKIYVTPFQKKWKCKVFNEWKYFTV
ncbi:MAG: hypothetical protein IJA27_03850 [Lachnospiraceae bacterium]|nr:hypothetical protein [Lachnospiraceae bacterium]